MNNTASTTNTNKRQGIDDSSKTLPKKQKLSVEEKRKIIQDKKAKLAESIASLTSKGVIQSDQTFSLKSMPIHPSLLKDAKFVPSKFSTTLANKNQLDLLAIKQLPIPVVVTKQVTETQFLKLQRKDPYFDRSLNSHAVSAPLKHAYRPMTFLAPGKYIRDASIQRKEEEEKNQLEIIAFKSFNTDSMKKDTFIGVKIRHHLLVPEIEWWDAPFLKGGHYPTAFQNVDDMNSDLITGLIHHPIPALLVAKKVTPVIQKVILTQKETKKLRRISRLEAQKERQERQRMGLEKEQVDKLKFSNFMR